MHKSMLKQLALFALSGATAYAGSFTADFSNPSWPGYYLNQMVDTSGNNYPILTNNQLLVLYNEGSIGPASMVVNDLDGGAAIDSFTANFTMQIGPGTSTPADGVAFAFGPDITQFTTFNEQGPNMPGGGVCVCFVTYAGDGPGIGVNVRVMGDNSALGGIVQGGYIPMASATMVDSQMHNVSIQVNRNGTLNMVWNGNVIYTNLYLGGWVPTQGQFAFGGRNGGDTEQILLGSMNITTTKAPATPVAPTITAQPQSATVNEGASATFSVGYDGDAPLTLQWYDGSSAILNATNPVLKLTAVSYTENSHQITCKVSGTSTSATSQAVTLTVIKDTTPPTVTKASSDMTFTKVLVGFSEPVSDTALAAANYKVDQGITVLSVARVDASDVALTTSKLPVAGLFTLTINSVQDMAATPNTIAANSQIQFRSYVYMGGAVLHKKYDNCNDGFSLANLLSDTRYPSNPDRVDILTMMEYPPNNTYRVAADPVRNYYDSIEGYFIPPATGNYAFLTCGDDEYYLYLSTDDSPANMYQVCAQPGGWSDQRNWTAVHSGSTETERSDQNTGTSWPLGNTITLNAAQRYYMIAFHHDHSWSGGDWFGATYKKDTDADPAVGAASILTGSVVGYYFDPTGASITYSQQPQSASAVEGTTATFSAAATGSSVYGTTILYQWQSAPSGSATWANVSGATAASLTTSILGLADNGSQYRVVATVTPISVTSSVATLTVLADTTPPVLSAGAMMDPTAGTVDVGVAFNKPVDDVSGSNPANYSLSSGTITSFTWCTNRFTADSQNPLVMIRKQSALLTVTGLSGSAIVTVKNITDTHGNKVTSTNIPVTVAANLSWGVVGANQLASNGWWNAAAPVAPNGFDVYSDGVGEWGTYDETTFVYEKVTGDFDKKVRVEYQDGSSTWGRAGIIVRDVLNFGVDQAAQTGSAATAPPYDGLAGRYQKCHVNPVGLELSGPGNQGNASWEGNRRLDTGGASTSCLTNANATPLYPNAWCRIQRKGQTFSIFRSADGVNWELLGQTVWGQDDQTKTPMPDTLYVGPEFSPENGNVTLAADKGTFLARFRDYGDYVAVFNPQLMVTPGAAGHLTITWASGTLVSSPTVNGTYTVVTGATNPYPVSAAGKAMFYRVKQ